MKLFGFSINQDFISFRYPGGELDLHNNYQFIELRHCVPSASVALLWLRREEEWVPAGIPARIELTFSGVNLLKVAPRDREMPATEDSCLDMVGFLWDELLEEMGGCTKTVPEAGCSHFCAVFSGGSSIKVGAAAAALSVVANA